MLTQIDAADIGARGVDQDGLPRGADGRAVHMGLGGVPGRGAGRRQGKGRGDQEGGGERRDAHVESPFRDGLSRRRRFATEALEC